MNKRKILFLHTELAGYFLTCIEKLKELYNAEIHLVIFPINKEAPFIFNFKSGINFYKRENYSEKELIQLCKQINPEIIFCTGWIDKTYLKISKFFYGKIPTVLYMDNHWEGTVKQRLAVKSSPLYLLNKFSNIWVPGLYQYEFARRLGFEKNKILTGMYSADLDSFQKYYEQRKKLNSLNKVFLYVGRYIASKGVKEMWQAFIELNREHQIDWELWCAGTGDLQKEFPAHPKIKNFGFVQPKDLGPLCEKAGVFVLPSHFEPWGVVVHEFSACGMPLLCSDRVGAATAFLVDGYNGFLFEAKNKKELKAAMFNMMQLPEEELNKMPERSFNFAKTISPQIWATKAWRLIKQ